MRAGRGDLFEAVVTELPERVYRVRRDGRLVAWWGQDGGARPSRPRARRRRGRNVRELLAPESADELLQMVEAAAGEPPGPRPRDRDPRRRGRRRGADHALRPAHGWGRARVRCATSTSAGRSRVRRRAPVAVTRELFSLGSLDVPLLMRDLLCEFCRAVGAVGASVWVPDEDAACATRDVHLAPGGTRPIRRGRSARVAFRSPSWVVDVVESLAAPAICPSTRSPPGPRSGPRQRAAIRDLSHRLRTGGVPRSTGNGDLRLPGPTGTARAVALDAFTGLATLVASVLERDRSEQYRRESDGKLRSLIGGNDIVIVLDAEGEYKWIGPSVEALTGYSLETLRSEDRAETIHPDDLSRSATRSGRRSPWPASPSPSRSACADADGTIHHVVATLTNLLEGQSASRASSSAGAT